VDGVARVELSNNVILRCKVVWMVWLRWCGLGGVARFKLSSNVILRCKVVWMVWLRWCS
jgi:hypothetical protein